MRKEGRNFARICKIKEDLAKIWKIALTIILLESNIYTNSYPVSFDIITKYKTPPIGQWTNNGGFKLY